ncbi:hypothetical protein ACI3EY_12935, partial [Ornithinimicrobium sp. LYQ92]|uniref:hypothetical protein n=1 Tax=Serinicoccus sp. LYQ92 TaxID=3378798 RepID=UPI003851C3DF
MTRGNMGVMTVTVQAPPTPIGVAEYFAGIGLMAAALEPRGFEVKWANDIEVAKRDLYVANRPSAADRFSLGD